jgi:hypothetical protein
VSVFLTQEVPQEEGVQRNSCSFANSASLPVNISSRSGPLLSGGGQGDEWRGKCLLM